MLIKQINIYLNILLKNYLNGYLIKDNKIILFVKNNYLISLVNFFKLNSKIKINNLMDITATDFISNLKNRFEITYSFWSLFLKTRIYIKLFVNDNKNKSVISLKSVFNSLLD